MSAKTPILGDRLGTLVIKALVGEPAGEIEGFDCSYF